MIIVRLMGGLGNQMFQYAAGLRLARRHNTDLELDVAYLLDRTLRGVTFRDFDLAIFKLAEKTAPASEVEKFRRRRKRPHPTWLERIADRLAGRVPRRRHYYFETNFAFQPDVLGLPDETYLEGYFQDERYFRDIEAEVRKLFQLQTDESTLPAATQRLAGEIRAANSICLHVRRGDYVTNAYNHQFHGVCSLDYYRRALAELRARGADGPVFIFSDDVGWCRENFPTTDGLTVVGNEHAGAHSATHFWLMTQCRNFVIPNSTFGWWAAWLSENPDKIVVRPADWFQSPKYRDRDICPPAWIKVANA